MSRLPHALCFMLTAALAAAPAQAQDAKPAPGAKQEAAKKPAQRRAKPGAPGPWIGLEPRAIEILKATSARLAAAKTMTFTSIATYEHPSRLGLPLAYTTRSQVTLQRPDKLKVVTPGDGPASEFYYDGKTMMAYAPAEKLLAVADAPPAIDAALLQAFKTAAIYFPFTDFVVADPYADIADGIRLAFYIGQSTVVGGTTTDMIAFQLDHAFVQLWVGAEDKLPRLIRAVYRDDPSLLRHQAEFSNWQLDAALPGDAFSTKNSATAMRIPFARPDPVLPVGMKPAIRPRPAKKS